ncbi:MAG: metabolite traffic protein EboE [Desulfobacterales bacterium]
MLICEKPPVHLTYCLSVHPGETWEENFEAIKTIALEIRDRVTPDRPFSLGLRLGHTAADSLSSPSELGRFRTFLEEHNLYVYSINGFPYGTFHNARVKENVYQPDWRASERLSYTLKLADILAELLPPGISGSISTAPGSYKGWIKTDADRTHMIRNLMACVAHLSKIEERTGKEIHVGLEPEPDCYLETTEEAVAFFKQDLAGEGKRQLVRLTGRTEPAAEEMIYRHLGICFDTCHMSLQFEDLSESLSTFTEQGIRISNVQLSAAIRMTSTERSLERLSEFCDPVYLHQVKIRDEANRKEIVSFKDLPDALEKSAVAQREGMQWRVHFHVPLYFEGDQELYSTSSDLTPDFFSRLRESGCEHLEIETYTFNVLPEYLKSKGLVRSVSDEYAWVLEQI